MILSEEEIYIRAHTFIVFIILKLAFCKLLNKLYARQSISKYICARVQIYVYKYI